MNKRLKLLKMFYSCFDGRNCRESLIWPEGWFGRFGEEAFADGRANEVEIDTNEEGQLSLRMKYRLDSKNFRDFHQENPQASTVTIPSKIKRDTSRSPCFKILCLIPRFSRLFQSLLCFI
jgi:hypothetical protein